MPRLFTLPASVVLTLGLAAGAVAQTTDINPAAPIAPPVAIQAPAVPAAPADAPAAVTPPAAVPATAADADPALAQDGADPLREELLHGRRGGGHQRGGRGDGGAHPDPVSQQAAGTAEVAHDLSPAGMYRQADVVVKSVMIALAIACFLTWTVFLFKLIEIAVAKGRARKAARLLTRATSLAEAVGDLGKRRDPAAFMARAIQEEYRRSDAVVDVAGAEGLKERAVSIVGRVDAQATARLRRGMGVLATVGSVSPFVGLFGTVWGIMNSFIGIASSGTTNLAVVAPGIAEALFATAIGLVAAIPAVVIYNHFTRGIAAYKLNLGDAGAAALRLLSRDIDFRHAKEV